MLDDLRGVIAPFTTLFAEDDSLTLGAVAAQLDWLVGQGVHGLAAGGSTGEGHALTREEHRDLLAETVRAAGGRVPVVAGIISNSTAETAARARWRRSPPRAGEGRAPEAMAPSTRTLAEPAPPASGSDRKFRRNER